MKELKWVLQGMLCGAIVLFVGLLLAMPLIAFAFHYGSYVFKAVLGS